jgi:hypothetical protein
LIVEVGFQCELGGALDTSETSAVEEGEVLQGADLQSRIHNFFFFVTDDAAIS